MREKMRKLKYPVRSLIDATGAFLSGIGLILLIYRAATTGTVWHVVSYSIYGTTLIAVWTMSTVYHSLNVSSAAKRTLEQLDHAMIYLLIAGTYTPICLVVLRGGWGWSLFGINWTLAVAGVVLKIVFRHPSRGVIALLFVFYIIMGWLVIVAWLPLIRVLPEGGVFWLVLGGIFYTVGAYVFNIKGLNLTPQFGAHEIWHLFVMAGSFSHFWLMWQYVLYLK